KGHLPHTNRIFKLTGVKQRFEGKALTDLEEEDRLRFEDTVIHAMIIQQMVPEDNKSSVFHIFERLNTNGTPLQPQEMRAAIYHGNFQEMLGQVNENTAWREVFGPQHKRSKDQELILRFLALRYNRENYSRPMKGFLNQFMEANQNKSKGELAEYADAFGNTIERSFDALGKQAFRPVRSINVAVYDALMVAIAENASACAGAIKHASQQLTSDEGFRSMVSEGTSDDRRVKARIQIAKEALDHAVATHNH
ncbi:MAG: hypothetical protein OXC91_03645, partial [Rhodobacteraceae bacterium]|nr:hypothetical protein [Paracoccaceae bacterium]